MNDPEHHEEAIFDHASRIASEAERAAYLDQACRGDSDLRARLELLLEGHFGEQGFLGDADPHRSGRTLRGGQPEEEIGAVIGRYKLLERIGEGGCGVVYMAEQAQPIRRRVALKVIKLGMDTKAIIARFEAERQALALMDHPNIARVLDAGATDTGRPFFVMELVRGVRITDYCDQNNFSTEQRLGLFIQVCHAIQHAHQKGIIHRDIKPSNILVTVNDGMPVPKVIDFGIAKATGGQLLTDKTLFTAFNQFIGTPAYMSPEQAEITSLDIDTRSDIYALGALLYELLTGQTPFDGKKLIAAGLNEMRRIIREEEPPRPSTRLSTLTEEERTTVAKRRQAGPPALMHLVRGDLDWIVMKCLEKDRARRYETALGLVDDIERHLKSEPIRARPPGGFYRLQKAVQRHKTAFAFGGLFLGVLIGGIVVSTLEAVRATRTEQEQIQLRKAAEASQKKAETEAAKSKQVAGFLESVFLGASVYAELALDRDSAALREIMDRTAARIGKGLTNQPEVEAQIRLSLASTYSGLGDWSKAEAMAREAVRLQKSVLGETNKYVADSLAQLTFILGNGEKLDEAEATGREALAITRITAGNEGPQTAAALDCLGAVLGRRQDKLQEAEQLEREALALARKYQGTNRADAAWNGRHLAEILRREGKHAESESLGREVLALNRELYGESLYTLLAINSLGSVLQEEGKLAEAEDLFREGWGTYRRTNGVLNWTTLTSLERLSTVLIEEGKLADADAYLREEVEAENSTTNLPALFFALAYLANVVDREGKATEARSLAERAIALWTSNKVDAPLWQVSGAVKILKGVLLDSGDASSLEPLTTWLLQDERSRSHPDDAASKKR